MHARAVISDRRRRFTRSRTERDWNYSPPIPTPPFRPAARKEIADDRILPTRREVAGEHVRYVRRFRLEKRVAADERR